MDTSFLLNATDLKQLYEHLSGLGEMISPTVQGGVISYQKARAFEDLPFGWTDVQGPGMYKLEKQSGASIFSYRVAPTSWKPVLYPPKELVFTAVNTDSEIQFTAPPKDETKRILFGVRPCELRAIRIQEKTLFAADYEPYLRRLKNCIIVAVACVQPGQNCFCSSVGSGPDVKDDCDLSLVEWGVEPRYLLQAKSKEGQSILEELKFPTADADVIVEAQNAVSEADGNMGREIDISRSKDLLIRQHDNHRFEKIAERCTSCGNCTLVCPTCFCSNLEDHTSLDGQSATRERIWDSCFTRDFTMIHGGYAREKPVERYRQWLTHKLSNWETQFDEVGCVGCGRCLTWCPEGIDITEEYNCLVDQKREPAIRYEPLT